MDTRNKERKENIKVEGIEILNDFVPSEPILSEEFIKSLTSEKQISIQHSFINKLKKLILEHYRIEENLISELKVEFKEWSTVTIKLEDN